MKVSLKIAPTDLSAFRQNLLRVSQNTRIGADAGLGEAAQHVFSVAQNKVPRVTGALANSAKLSTHNTDNVLRRTIGYGDATSNPRTGKATSSYATHVHEVFNPAHPNSYKWLELSLREYGTDKFLSDLASAIRGAL